MYTQVFEKEAVAQTRSLSPLNKDCLFRSQRSILLAPGLFAVEAARQRDTSADISAFSPRMRDAVHAATA